MPRILFGWELGVGLQSHRLALDRLQRKLGRWLLRDHNAPNAVVLGDLHWRPWSHLLVERAVGLWCRLLQAPVERPSFKVLAASNAERRGWVFRLRTLLQELAIPEPFACGAGPGSPASARRAYIREVVRPRLLALADQAWRAQSLDLTDPGLMLYRRLVPRPRAPIVFTIATAPAAAAAWCRMRHHGSLLPAHRLGRHVVGCRDCVLCQTGAEGSWQHCLQDCPAPELRVLREQWRGRAQERFPWTTLATAEAGALEDFFLVLRTASAARVRVKKSKSCSRGVCVPAPHSGGNVRPGGQAAGDAVPGRKTSQGTHLPPSQCRARPRRRRKAVSAPKHQRALAARARWS